MIKNKCDICNKKFEGHTIGEVNNQIRIHKQYKH